MNKILCFQVFIISLTFIFASSAATRSNQNLRGKNDRELNGKNKHLHHFQSRIVGGEDAASGDFKFMVSWAGSCGGSLIHDEFVLTAAHCGGITGQVRIGSDFVNSGGEVRSVSRKIQHPSYDSFNLNFDYMILQLNSPVDISQFQPIKLNSNVNEPSTDELLTVIGFGATSENGPGSTRLQKVQVPANSHQQCRNQYGPSIRSDVHLCAGFQSGGKDSCQGDSGGPIFQNRGGTQVQVGVVSFGDGCARPNKSGVYARTSGATDWIEAQICKFATVNRPASCGPPGESDDNFAGEDDVFGGFDDFFGGFDDDFFGSNDDNFTLGDDFLGGFDDDFFSSNDDDITSGDDFFGGFDDDFFGSNDDNITSGDDVFGGFDDDFFGGGGFDDDFFGSNDDNITSEDDFFGGFDDDFFGEGGFDDDFFGSNDDNITSGDDFFGGEFDDDFFGSNDDNITSGDDFFAGFDDDFFGEGGFDDDFFSGGFDDDFFGSTDDDDEISIGFGTEDDFFGGGFDDDFFSGGSGDEDEDDFFGGWFDDDWWVRRN